jgi:hypothetical protein
MGNMRARSRLLVGWSYASNLNLTHVALGLPELAGDPQRAGSSNGQSNRLWLRYRGTTYPQFELTTSFVLRLALSESNLHGFTTQNKLYAQEFCVLIRILLVYCFIQMFTAYDAVSVVV